MINRISAGIVRLFAIVFSGALVSCGIIDLGTVTFETFPSANCQTLPLGIPLSVTFSEPVERNEAESTIKISGDDGIVGCDSVWEGNTILLVPIPGLHAGERYTLRVSGLVRSEDGKHRTHVEKKVDFTYAAVLERPCVNFCFPPEGSSAGPGTEIAIGFDQAMERVTVERAFSVSPSKEKVFSWNEESTEVKIEFHDQFEACTFVEWKVSRNALSSQGSRLAFEAVGRFSVHGDVTPPEVVSILPGNVSGGEWYFFPSSVGLGDLEKGNALIVTLSEGVEMDSAERAFSVYPPIDGRFIALANDAFAWAMDSTPETGKEYSAEVSADLADLSGVRAGKPWKTVFTANDVSPRVSRAVVQGVDVSTPGISAFAAVPDTSSCMTFTVTFSRPLSERCVILAADLVSCQAFFPPSLISPNLLALSFDPGRTVLSAKYSDFTRSTPLSSKYYRFTLEGGPSGFGSAATPMKDDFTVMLETTP